MNLFQALLIFTIKRACKDLISAHIITPLFPNYTCTYNHTCTHKCVSKTPAFWEGGDSSLLKEKKTTNKQLLIK